MGKVAVTQADREQAYQFEPRLATAYLIRFGMRDDHALVQAIATTRIATAEACARIAGDEGERLDAVWKRMVDGEMGRASVMNQAIASRRIAFRIRFRLQQGSGKP